MHKALFAYRFDDVFTIHFEVLFQTGNCMVQHALLQRSHKAPFLPSTRKRLHLEEYFQKGSFSDVVLVAFLIFIWFRVDGTLHSTTLV